MTSWYDHARAALTLVDDLPPRERERALQWLQEQAQRELARLWAASASPGHSLGLCWPAAGKGGSER